MIIAIFLAFDVLLATAICTGLDHMRDAMTHRF